MIRAFLFLGIGVLAFWTWALWSEVFSSGKFTVVFFDIGQGDAIYIQTPYGHRMLVDAGADRAILEKLRDHVPFWNRTIDLAILTHPHTDHIGGFIGVFQEYEVKNILWPAESYDTRTAREVERGIALQQENGANVVQAMAPQIITWSNAEDEHMAVINPSPGNYEKYPRHIHETSIVARMVYGDLSMLLTGDAERDTEAEILTEGWIVRSTILKAGHHGSRTSSSDPFVRNVWPEIAVIQAGEGNRYGHPHAEVLEVFERYGITVFRNDIHGDITIIAKQ